MYRQDQLVKRDRIEQVVLRLFIIVKPVALLLVLQLLNPVIYRALDLVEAALKGAAYIAVDVQVPSLNPGADSDLSQYVTGVISDVVDQSKICDPAMKQFHQEIFA